MKSRDSWAFTLSLYPLPVAIVLLIWPCLGVTVVVGGTALTLSLVVSDLDELARRPRSIQ